MSVPDGIDEKIAASVMRQGLTASHFATNFYPVQPGDRFCPRSHVSEDLKRIDVCTLILHADDGQIVPLADSALLSAKLVKDALLQVYKSAPHGMCTTHKSEVDADLPAFAKAWRATSTKRYLSNAGPTGDSIPIRAGAGREAHGKHCSIAEHCG